MTDALETAPARGWEWRLVDKYDLTKIQAKIMIALYDGKPHHKDELLLTATGKKFASSHLIATHIHRIRQKLAHTPEVTILSVGDGLYQMRGHNG